MDLKKWQLVFAKEERLKLKWLALVLGLLLLLILLLGNLFIRFSGEEEPEIMPEPVPVIRILENVWIMEVAENRAFSNPETVYEPTGSQTGENRVIPASVTVFADGKEEIFVCQEGVEIPENAREQLADIVLSDEKVIRVICKTDKINGKVLAVDDKGIALEGIGYYPFSRAVKGYRLYGSLKMCTAADLAIGYDFADFVIENGQICGILMVKEDIMEYIRVLIKGADYQSLLHDTVVFTCDSDYEIRYGSYEEQVREFYHAGEVCTVDLNSAFFQSERIQIVPSVLTGKVSLHNVKRSQGVPSYRGTIELIKTESGIAVINEVLLEEYLYSVVPSEMPASYPAEALKAQAICARTYAYRYLLHAGYPAYGAHVDDSTGYQVYNNIVEQEATTTAVKETYGQILTDSESGQPAQTYYYSTSCGIGSDANVWNVDEENSSPSYLTPMPINRSAVEYMKAMWSQEQVGGDITLEAQALREEAVFEELIRGRKEEDYEAEESWYRWSYHVETPDAEAIKERLAARWQVNPARILVLQKNGSFAEGKVKDFTEIRQIVVCKRGAGGVASELLIETDAGTYKVLTEYNIRYVLCDGKTMVVRQDGSRVKAPTLLPSGYFVIEVVLDGEDIVGYQLTGGGYGHGVGMSQNGARNMAADGLDCSEIVRFFYQGCVVKNIYE